METIKPRRYFTIAAAVRHKLIPFGYQLALARVRSGEIKAKRIGNAYYTCVEWINEYFES